MDLWTPAAAHSYAAADVNWAMGCYQENFTLPYLNSSWKLSLKMDRPDDDRHSIPICMLSPTGIVARTPIQYNLYLKPNISKKYFWGKSSYLYNFFIMIVIGTYWLFPVLNYTCYEKPEGKTYGFNSSYRDKRKVQYNMSPEILNNGIRKLKQLCMSWSLAIRWPPNSGFPQR